MRCEGKTALALLLLTCQWCQMHVLEHNSCAPHALTTDPHMTGAVAGAEPVCRNVLQAGRAQKERSAAPIRGVQAVNTFDSSSMHVCKIADCPIAPLLDQQAL